MSLFVVYNMTTTEVKAVYDNTSEELLDMFEKFCDFFRNTNFRNDGQGNQVEIIRKLCTVGIQLSDMSGN